MRDLLQSVAYWSLTIFFSMIIAIPIAAAFIFVILILVQGVHDGY